MIAHPIGVVTFVGAVLIFMGSIYSIVALNLGWRFGYWVTAASLGGLGLIMTTFWFLVPVGPRGNEPRWVPVAVDAATISQAHVRGKTLSSVANYPAGTWKTGELAEANNLKSAISTCLDAKQDALEAMTEAEREVCTKAQSLLPTDEMIPEVELVPVTVANDPRDIRFGEEQKAQLAQAIITPSTKDPRLTKDPDGLPIGKPFRLAAYKDLGSLRWPAFKFLVGTILFAGFHLWGLSRAERRRLSPIAA